MNISERAQEILEKCWLENKEGKKLCNREILPDDPVAVELIKGGYARAHRNRLDLTDKGWKESRGCVRRHRLSERLLADVLLVKEDMLHNLGCKFEHALQKDVEENICTLLGHPRTCPHGSVIPEGNCCRKNKRTPNKVIAPLSECRPKQKGRISYIRTESSAVLNKLTAMGILPGMSIQLLRRRPAYLFKVGESQFAIDKELAEKIQIRLSE
ncbi:MAG: metal-dependent transcriptional regulator [Candidatus Omnitrophota bacterium]|nr:metal-dependent transcriptional regulator [Candidatus Omnitrophota bacterium]